MSSRSRTDPALPIQRISGPEELLQAVPYLLGFHPADSLVLVGLDGKRVTVSARLDLADVVFGGARYTLTALAECGSTSVIGVVYDHAVSADDCYDERPWQDLVLDIEVEADALGCRLDDAVLVSGNRYWSLMCSDFTCCPREGREVEHAGSAFSAAATYAGLVALPDRAALVTMLDPLPDDDRNALVDAIGRVEYESVRLTIHGGGARYERAAKRAVFAAARASEAPDWHGTSDADVSRFAAALRITPIRDAVWMAIDDRRIDGRPLWRDLGRRLPSPYDAPPLFLYGWASWRHCEGALARIAADRAVLSNPDYTAADLLLAALNQVVDPRRMPRLRSAKQTA
jgi:hypothetical protein